MMTKTILWLLITLSCLSTHIFAVNTPFPYSENNQGKVSFDVSMPIDASGYTLHGKNLTGGDIQFNDNGNYVSDFLASEMGDFVLPIVTSLDGKPLFKTSVNYHVIKFIDPVGIDNFFIKIGTAARTQTVAGLDLHVLKNGTYTWQVPIFASGHENDSVDHKIRNFQFMQVGASGGPAHSNAEYTQEFYLYTQGHGNRAIAAHPQYTARLNDVLPKAYSSHFSCYAHGIWGSKADPYRKILGRCAGSSMTFPAGPNLDYEYGTFTLPSVITPWDATPKDHCVVNGKQHAGCTTAKIDSEFHYVAQKIRVPLKNGITVFAEAGTAYRSITPHNLRYVNNNVYLKNLIKPDEYLKKSYLPGGFSTPYFAVGYEFKKNGVRYEARYVYINESENSNRIAWRDASDTQIYAVSVSSDDGLKPSHQVIKENFNNALNAIRQVPAVYEVLGKYFFVEILKKNNIYE